MSNNLTITGTVLRVCDPVQTGTGKWRQQIVIEMDGKYRNRVCFSVWESLINSLSVGEYIFVHLTLEAKPLDENRFVCNVNAWKIEKL